jgi:hypothetical protein
MKMHGMNNIKSCISYLLTEMESDDDDRRWVDIHIGRISTGRLEIATNVFRRGADITGIAVDTYQVGKAIYTDCTKTKKKRPGKRTLRAVASVAGGRAAAVAGSTVGAYVGGAIGAACGGVGAVPGAFIGGLVGGIVGSIGGSTAAKAVVNEWFF